MEEKLRQESEIYSDLLAWAIKEGEFELVRYYKGIITGLNIALRELRGAE